MSHTALDGQEFGVAGSVYLAGMPAPPGRYRRIDGADRLVDLRDGQPLPPSFDGRVALYVPLTSVGPLRPTA